MNMDKLKQQLKPIGKQFMQLKALIYVVALMVCYIFIAYRINVLTQVEPTQTAINAQLSPVKNPHIDPAIVNKIQQLQDNSVSVQTLFNQARQNPFNE